MARPLFKNNPAFLSEEDLIRSFVVRQADLDMVLGVLRENTTAANQHVLIVGPRGIGKTTLVLRAAAEVRRAPELKDRWYPLIFAEESYEVSTPGEFWLEAVFHLHQQTHDPRWERAYAELRGEKDETRLRERALAQLMDFADAKRKRLLIVVENLNMLLGEQVGADDAWTLRHTLLNESRIMLLATATCRFAEVENAGRAMFELFKVHELRPLDLAECSAVWAAVSGEESRENRVRPIQILTGGNPRLLAIIAAFAAKPSLRHLLRDLMQLADEHTEYFKSHLDGLPGVERKVYVALADLWEPSTAREVAVASRLEVSKVSALLGRLVQRGAVVVTAETGRTKRYQLAERMYNIYHLMRRRGAPSDRVRGLVDFMVHFYGHDGPPRVSSRIAEEAGAYPLELGTASGQVAVTMQRTVEAAAREEADAALAELGEPHHPVFGPLAIGIRLDRGEEVIAAAEMLEVGRDIAKRIAERRREIQAGVK